MKKIFLFLLILALLTSFVSCNNKESDFRETEVFENSSVKAESYNDGAFDVELYDKEIITEDAVFDTAPTLSDVSKTYSDTTLRKIIYSSSFSVETKNFEESISRLDSLIKENEAWIETSNTYGTKESGNRSASYIVRIPTEKFNAFISGKNSIGTVVSTTENNRDVTEQYVDTEARLESATLREERVLEILENAASLDDVLALERELSDIRYEIESLTGSLRKLDSLVQYATCEVFVREVSVYTPKAPETLTFGERVAKAFKSGLEDFEIFIENVVLFVIYNFVAIIFWTAVIVVVTIVVVRKVKKTKTKKEE